MDDNTRNMIIEYERILRTDSEKKLAYGFFRYNDENNEKTAIELFKYVFEKILDWSPADVINNASEEFIRDMKLGVPYAKLRFPKELNPKTDYFYIAKIVYPDKVPMFSKRDLILIMYRNVLDKKDNKFPKDYFSTEDGEVRSKVCLQYALQAKPRFRNIQQMYEYFADDSSATAFFKECRLDFAAKTLYKNGLEYLHLSLNTSQQDCLLYAYLSFKKCLAGSPAGELYEQLIQESEQVAETDMLPASYDKERVVQMFERFMQVFKGSDAEQVWKGMVING